MPYEHLLHFHNSDKYAKISGEIAQLLVEGGADLEIVDNEQKRASDYVREFPEWSFLVDKTTPFAAVA